MPQQVGQGLAHQGHVDGPAGDPAKVPDAVQGALQFADIAAQLVGEETQHVVAQRAFPARLGPGTEDGQPGFGFGRQQAPDRAPQQPIRQLRRKVIGQARMAVAGQHHLPAVGQQRVERVQELLLGRTLAGQEVEVIQQQRVALAELLAEDAELAQPHRLHEAVGEVLAGDIGDAPVGDGRGASPNKCLRADASCRCRPARAAPGDWGLRPGPR